VGAIPGCPTGFSRAAMRVSAPPVTSDVLMRYRKRRPSLPPEGMEVATMDYVRLVYRPLATGAARHALVGRNRTSGSADRGRFTRPDVDGLLKHAWRLYGDESVTLPVEPTIGSRMNVRLACFTMSFFKALIAAGTERQYAIELVADATWRIYRIWSVIASTLAHLRPGKRTALAFAVGKRGKTGGAVSLTFPFNAPGYVIEVVPVEAGTAFNVLRCPVADYFRTQDAADLCTSSWCNLDYPLAELTGEKLVRTSTLVTGGRHCDFRLS
jgi:hypothetical protein